MADFRTAPGAAFALIPANVLYDPNLTDKAKMVFAEISRLVGTTGYCWARDQALAEVCACSVRTVSRAIHDLAAAGYIQVEIGANTKGTERHIFVGQFAPRGGIDKNGETPQGIDKNGETPIAKNGETPPPTQYKKNNKNTDIRAGARARAREVPEAVDAVFRTFAGDDAELYQRIMELAEVRRSKRDPYTTPPQAKKLCDKLRKYCGTDRAYMLALLDEAIEKGWKSVYVHDNAQPRPAATGGAAIQEAADVETWEG